MPLLILPVFPKIYTSYDEALKILSHLEATRDGITLNERINLRLRRMNLKRTYRQRYKIGGTWYDLHLPDFEPAFAQPAHKLPEDTPKEFLLRADIQLEMSEADMDAIMVAFVNMAGDRPVRMFDHHAAAAVAAGVVRFIAAEETRRRKQPYGVSLMRKMTDEQRFARSVLTTN